MVVVVVVLVVEPSLKLNILVRLYLTGLFTQVKLLRLALRLAKNILQKGLPPGARVAAALLRVAMPRSIFVMLRVVWTVAESKTLFNIFSTVVQQCLF